MSSSPLRGGGFGAVQLPSCVPSRWTGSRGCHLSCPVKSAPVPAAAFRGSRRDTFFFYFGRTETGEWGLCVATRAELEPAIP